MKKTILTASVLGMILAGCGGGGEGQSSVVVSGNVNTNSSTSTPTPSTEGKVVVPTINTSDRELAVLYKVNSTFTENRVTQRSIQQRAGNTIYEGTLKAVDKDGVETLFDWPSYLDTENQIAIAQKTLLLKEGSYELSLLLENGEKQFVGTKTAVINDNSQLELVFDLHSLIGDVILNVNEVEELSKFNISFVSTQLSSFNEPILGVTVNTNDEIFLSINKDTGALAGVLNLNDGDSVQFNFYDGASHEGKAEAFIISDGTKNYPIDFTPLFGEVFFGTDNFEGNTTFRANFAADTVASIGTDFDTILKYDNNGNYGEKNVTLVENLDSTFTAEVPLENITYGKFNYTLSFVDKTTNLEFAKCMAEIADLTSLDVSNSCKVVIQKESSINNNLLAVFGVNINDNLGRGEEGFSIYMDNEFIGYTGSGTFGTTGYLKSLAESGEHVLKAEKNGESYLKNISIDPLSVNNYSFVTDSNDTNAELASVISSESFTVTQGSQDSGLITLTNTGNVEVTYNVRAEDSAVAQERQRSLSSTVFEETRIFKSVDFANKTVSFEYINGNGNLITSKTIKEDELPSRVIIKYKEGQQRSSGNNLEIKEIDNSSLEKFVEELNALESDSVEYIEPDTKLRMFNLVKPEDELFSFQWGLHNDGLTFGSEDSDTDWLEFYNTYSPSNYEVVVAVIDTGVDYTHPDINDNMWINSGEIANNGIDDDNNGYIDDVYGYDFINNDGDPLDDNGHGTHVAGIIAAEKNSIGTVGVNPYSVKVMALKFLDATGSGYTSDVIKAVQYSLDNGAHISNNSWGCTGSGCYSVSLEDAIRQTVDKEQIFVTSSGNEASNVDSVETYPSNYDIPTIISVGNSDFSDLLAESSNYGLTNVDVLAPGTDIVSLWPNNAYVLATGTSMSAPFVTGLVSVLYNKGEGNTPYQGIMNNIFTQGDETVAAKSSTKYGTRINMANSYNNYQPTTQWFSIKENATGTLQPGEAVTVPFSIDLTYFKGGASKGKKVVIENSANELTHNISVAITK